MPSALILIADGSEEIEFVTPYDVLVRAGFDVTSVGVDLKNGSYAECSRRVKITPDISSIQDLPASPLSDILVLPGGAPGAATFCASKSTTQLINRYREKGKWVACICAATTALVRAAEEVNNEGGAGKCKVTSHPGVKGKIVEKEWEYSEDRVVIDGKVITSRGPGTALLFALTIVESLLGKAKRDEVAAPMIITETL